MLVIKSKKLEEGTLSQRLDKIAAELQRVCDGDQHTVLRTGRDGYHQWTEEVTLRRNSSGQMVEVPEERGPRR